jgi:hypothetical protein
MIKFYENSDRTLADSWLKNALAKFRAAPDSTNYGRLSDLSERWI